MKVFTQRLEDPKAGISLRGTDFRKSKEEKTKWFSHRTSNPRCG